MLENIRSSLILKKVFSYLNNKTKIRIIYYNKRLHNKISVSLDNLNSDLEKYIIYESKTIAKEYDYFNDKLLYEGGYLNKKRNGQGKEYFFGILIYEGEYLNGKRNGKGKEYYNNNQLKFEGEYLNGKRSGRGIEKIWNGIGYAKGKDYFLNIQNFLDYENNNNDIENNDIINQTMFKIKYGKGCVKEFDEYSKLIFEGEYINGERNGKGKEYGINNNIIFEGEYINGKRNGKGKEYDEQGELIFQGNYKNNKKWEGKGEIKKINEKNSFIIIYDLKDGQGYIKQYEYGEYYYGKKKGKVKEYYSNGKIKFEGEYLGGKKIGKGKEYDNYGKLEFEGEYLYGKKNGEGKEYTYRNENKLIFEGEYLNDYKIKGKEYNLKGTLMYEGEYLYDKKNGKGKEYYEDGHLLYEGEFLSNKRTNGKIYYYDYFGEYIYEIINGIEGKRINEKINKK